MKFVKYSALTIALASTSLALTAGLVYAQSQNLDFDTVIATWQPQQQSIANIDEAEKVLSSSRYLSAAGDERERVTRFANSTRKNFKRLNAGQRERLVLLEARLLQGIHQFEQAQQHLKQIAHFRSPAAYLLMADIAIQQGDVKKAKEKCEKLVGKTSFLMAFTCMVNAEFSQNAEPKYYRNSKLLRLSSVTRVPVNANGFTKFLRICHCRLATLKPHFNIYHRLSSNSFQ